MHEKFLPVAELHGHHETNFIYSRRLIWLEYIIFKLMEKYFII